MDERVILIKDGEVVFIHSDDLEELAELGKPTINRLSNVAYNNSKDKWEVSYEGKVLTRKKTRKEAIEWEVSYFNKRLSLGELNG